MCLKERRWQETNWVHLTYKIEEMMENCNNLIKFGGFVNDREFLENRSTY
jgi:hypothetical protein